MNGVVADTHAIIWYLLESVELSGKARQHLEKCEQQGQPLLTSHFPLHFLPFA